MSLPIPTATTATIATSSAPETPPSLSPQVTLHRIRAVQERLAPFFIDVGADSSFSPERYVSQHLIGEHVIRRLRDSHPDAVIEALRKPIHDMCHGLLSRRSMDLYLRFSSALRAAGIADQPTALAAPFGELPPEGGRTATADRPLISQTRVRLSTAVYLDTLGMLADVTQHSPSGVSRPAHLAVGLRLLRATLESTLSAEPLFIDLDEERTRAQRGSLTDREESLALRELYPALRQMAHDGDIAIRFLDRRDQHPEGETWRAINDQWSVSDDPSQAKAFIDLSVLPPLVARPPLVQPPAIPTVDVASSAPSSAPTTWRDHVDLSAEPRYVSRGGDAPPRRIRLFIALDDDIRIERMGQLALRKYAGDLVWVRLSRDGQWSLRAGSGLLVDAAWNASFQLIVGGQGQINAATGSRLMSGYQPQALADAIGALLKSLRSGVPARVESTRLLADSLKPPANGGFGRDFALAADRSGWARPGMKTTTYADLLSLGMDEPDGYRIFAKVDAEPGEMPPARDAGQAWQFWVENGEVHRQDKHMPAQDEVDRSLGRLGNTDPAAQARRVDRALVVLDQLPGWDDALSTSERQDLLQRVRQSILDGLKALPELVPTSPAHTQLLSDVSRDVAAGLLGERGRLRLAFTRLRDASSIANQQNLVAWNRVWPMRKMALNLTEELTNALFTRFDRTQALWATYFTLAQLYGNRLLAETKGPLSSKLARRVGWNSVVTATAGAATQRDVVVVDVNSKLKASGADIEIVRARHLIRHLVDTGVIGGALAVTSERPMRPPGSWREVSVQLPPSEASPDPTFKPLWLRELSDEAVLDAMPHVMAEVAGDHLVWSRPLESEVAGRVQEAADAPLAAALQRLSALRSENADEIKMLDFIRSDLSERRREIGVLAPMEPGTDYARLRRVAGDIAREVGVPMVGWREMRRRLNLDEGELTRLVEDALRIHASAIEAATQGMAALQARFRDERVGVSLDVLDALPADAPFAFFVDRGPDFSQSLDRRQGLITLRDRFMDVATEVRVRPLDAFEGPGISTPEAWARQDAEIRIAEALIVRLLDAPDGEFRLAPLGLESLPRRMAIDEAGFHVNGALVAVPREGLSAEQGRTVASGWRVKDDAAASLLRSLSAAERRGDWSIKHLPKLSDPPADAVPTRLKIVLQLAGDSDSATAAWLLARKHDGQAVWLQERGNPQADEPHLYLVAGERLLDRLPSGTEVDVLVVGHGGMSTAGEQTLSGWTPQGLAGRLRMHVQDLSTKRLIKLRRVSLISCDLASPYVETPFATAFATTLFQQPGMSRVSVTARTGRLHVISTDARDDERVMIVTERNQPDGEIKFQHRMPGDTVLYTSDGETGPFTITDKYPAGDADVPGRWSVFADLLPRSRDAVLSDPGAGPSSAPASKGLSVPQPEPGFEGLALPQRLAAVAASLQTRVAPWDLSAPPDLQVQRDALTDAAWRAFERKKPLSGKSRAVAEHMVEGLLTGSTSSFLKAYVGVLNAQGANVTGDPAKLQDVHAAYETLRTTAMEQLGTANADLRVHTNSAIAHLFGRAARATDGSPLRLGFDAIDLDFFLPASNIATAGVELELAGSLSRLHDSGFIGPVQWQSGAQSGQVGWKDIGDRYVSDMDAPARLWTTISFDPSKGLLREQPTRSFDPPPITDDRPLPGLAALEPKIRQSLDRRTGMVRLSWEDGEGSIGVARLRVDGLPPDVAGREQPRARALGDALRRLDLMVIALASNETGEIAPDRLPATLTLTGETLRSGELVVANRSPQGWSFKRGDAWTPPPRLAGGEPTLSMTGAGRARAIASSLSLVPEAWFGDPGKLGPYRHELVEGYGDTAFAAPDASVQIDPEVRRVAAETLMMGILEPSLATMERARRLLLDAANQAGTVGDESPDTRAARALRHLVEGAEQHLMGGTDQRAMTESVQGRLLADTFSSTLVSGPTTPFRLDYDRLRRGIEGPNASPEDTSYAALILSMRDELDLLSSTGVIGEVEYTRKRRPVGDGAKWRHDDEGLWIASDDILDEQWPTAVFDPDQHRVQRLRFNDLREGWGKLADELSVDVRSRELKEWLNETSRELKALLSRPRAAMAEGMSSEAWQRRVDEVSKLTQTPPDDPEVKALWDRVVARIRESAKLASSSAYQAAFGEGSRHLLPADSPLPFLGRARPDLKQRFDATSGALTIEKEGQTLTWQVQTAASTPATDRSWRQAQSLRELDVLLVASLDGTDSQSLPSKLLYESGELSADGVVIARIVPVAGWETAPAWDISDSEPESDVTPGTAAPARTEAKPEAVPEGSTQSKVAPPTEAIAASDEKPMDVDQPTTSTAEESTSRGTKRPLAKQDNVVPAKRVRPGGSSAADVDAWGIVSVETTGDTSPTIPNSRAINTLIVAWLDKQWSGAGLSERWNAQFREELSQAIRSAAQARGEGDSDAINELDKLVADPLIKSPRYLLLAIQKKFATNATVGSAASMSRGQVLSLMRAAIVQVRGPDAPLVAAWDSVVGWIYAALDSSRQGGAIRVDADALLRLQRSGHDGQSVARKFVDFLPVLEALSARGVIGAIKVVAKEEATRQRGSWAPGEDGYHIAKTPLHEILQDAGGVSPPALVHDTDDALPGFAFSWDHLVSPTTRRLPAVRLDVSTGRPRFIQISKVGNKLKSGVRTARYHFDIDDPRRASAAAMDLDVAAAHLIGDGSAITRMPSCIAETSQGISLARLHKGTYEQLPVELFVREGERLRPNEKVIEQFRAFMDAGDVPSVVARPPLDQWRHELLPRHQSDQAWTDLESTVRSTDDMVVRDNRRTIVLQMDDSPSTYEASLRVMAKERSKGRRTLWIQADHLDASQTLSGDEQSFGRDRTPIKLVIVGQGGNTGWATTLSGHLGNGLAERVTTVLGKHLSQEVTPPIDRITMLACKLDSDFASIRFTDEFSNGFKKISPANSIPELRITAYKDMVLFPNDKPSEPKFSQRWTVGEGEAQAIHHAKNRTSITIKHNKTFGVHGVRRELTNKYEEAPTTAPLSKDATKLALDTALDTDLDVAGSDADRINASIEKDLLFYRPDLGDELPSLTLRSLFADDQGVVDKERLDRIAGDVTEQAQLARDIESDLAGIKPEDVDSTPLRGLIDESFAGLTLKLAGQEVPAQWLASLGASIDGQPLTLDTLKATSGTDLGDRLSIDAQHFEQVLPLLPQSEHSARRLAALVPWLRRRTGNGAANSPFHGETSAAATDLAVRLTAVDVDGPASPTRSESLFAAVARPAATTEVPVPAETHDALSPVRTDEERRYQAVAKDLKDPLDLNRLSRLPAGDALRELHAAGLLEVDANGQTRLQEDRLAEVISDDAGVMRAATALAKLPQASFDALYARASKNMQARLDLVRQLRAQTADRNARGGFTGVAGHAFGLGTTMLGVYQIAQQLQHPEHADPTQIGLMSAQISSFGVTPLTVKLGTWMNDTGLLMATDARGAPLFSRMFTGAGKTLMAGGADVLLSGCGLTAAALQLDACIKAGLGPETYAFKSAVANLSVAAYFSVHSLVATGVNLAVLMSGGAEAVAGTLLGTVAGVVGAVALPAAILAFAINGVVGAVLWDQEYGKYIRGSTNGGDLALGWIAKFFGIETDVMRRAETEKNAHAAATKRAEMLFKQQFEELSFRADVLSKSGYGVTKHPVRRFTVKPATFKQEDGNYGFVLQDQSRFDAVQQTHGRLGAQRSPEGTAWIALADTPYPADGELRGADAGAQRFELAGVGDERHVAGGADSDIFLVDTHSAVAIDGGDGIDELVVDATGGGVELLGSGAHGSASLHLNKDSDPWRSRQSSVTNVEKITVRNASRALVFGDDRDNWFDVSAVHSAAISGGAGRNTYQLREGNRIDSSSDDAAVWSGASSATIDLDDGDTVRSLLLKVDVPHEALTFRRDGSSLMIGKDAASLTLLNFFEEGPPPPARPPREVAPDAAASRTSAADTTPLTPARRGLFIVDALGLHLTLLDPRRLDGQARGSATLNKHLYFDASAPASRRALTGDHGYTRHHLATGSGAFRLAPRNAMPMDITLDIAIDRLRYRRDGDDLVLIETPPANAPAGFTPLTLTLPGYSLRDWGETHGRLLLWARADEKAVGTVKLMHPEHDAPGEGPLHPVAPAAAGAPGASSTPSRTEDIAAPVEESPATAPDAQAVPVLLKSGERVYTGNSDLDVMATAPGRHLVLPAPAAPWSMPIRPRIIHVAPGAKALREGLSLKIVAGSGAHESVVFVLDYYLSPEHFQFEPLDREDALLNKYFSGHDHAPLLPLSAKTMWLRYRNMQADPWIAPLLLAAGIKDPARVKAISAVATALRDEVSPAETRHDPDAVRTYLELKGLPSIAARDIQSATTTELRRIRSLLAAMPEGAALPGAAFLDGYASSALDSPLTTARHGELLRALVTRSRPWPYAELAIRHGLNREALDLFEHWSEGQENQGDGGIQTSRALDEFGRLLNAPWSDDTPITADTQALLTLALQLKGRPAEVASAMATAMVVTGADEDWIDAMQRAGIADLTMLERLFDAKVSPRELEIGNANRLRYEGVGDRSGLIAVSTPDSFRQPETTLTRYVSRHYLGLDDDGDKFVRFDTTPQAGVAYDLLPGEVVDAEGRSPNLERARNEHDSRRYGLEEEFKDRYIHGKRIRLDKPEVKDYLDRKKATFIRNRLPPLSSVIQLVDAGVLQAEQAQVSGGWRGRSQPGNLVDGSRHGDEADSWRPYVASYVFDPDEGATLYTYTAMGPGYNPRFIQMDFAHAVALRGIRIDTAIAVLDKDQPDNSSGRWKLQAQSHDGEWLDVSDDFWLTPGTTATVAIKSDGVPYRHYRLLGTDGGFSRDMWMTELSFATAEAGGLDVASNDVLRWPSEKTLQEQADQSALTTRDEHSLRGAALLVQAISQLTPPPMGLSVPPFPTPGRDTALLTALASSPSL